MKDSRYIVIGIVLHVSWFLFGFQLFWYVGEVSFHLMYESWNGGSEGKELVQRANIYQILYLIYTCTLVAFHIRYFRRSQTKKKQKTLYLLSILGAMAVFITGYMLWWNYVPPMSEAKALEYANHDMKDQLTRWEYDQIKYDSINNRWQVRYRSMTDKDSCRTLNIGRVYKSKDRGSCTPD
ncbi:hypothetical protein [Paenibacillus sp. KS-LC4]|uniref:hypothetical protein n=1 Tax=Paenibacillus sp. KS-LC4 TaxID=2979727 RepID=UPI0030D11871